MTDAYSESFKSISMNLTDVWDIVEDSDGDGELPILEVEFLLENTVAGVLYTKDRFYIIGHPLADNNSHLYFDMDDLERVEAERDSIIEAENDLDFGDFVDSSDDEGDECEYGDIARARQHEEHLLDTDFEDYPSVDGSVGNRLPARGQPRRPESNMKTLLSTLRCRCRNPNQCRRSRGGRELVGGRVVSLALC